MTTRQFLADVKTQFGSLNDRGDRVAVMDGFPRVFRDKRYSVFDQGGGANNHFQGVQRMGKYLLVTGSYPVGRKRRADLLVFRLDSRSADPGPWGSNMVRSKTPLQADQLVNYFRIDEEYWHPGGFNIWDNHAVIPIENGEKGQSKIVFVDLTDPEEPKRRKKLDVERPESKAGACAITSLPDERLLLVVWSDSDKPIQADVMPPYHLDIYLSASPNDLTKFDKVAEFVPTEGHAFHKQFQCLDFIWQVDDSGSEKLFLVTFENTSPAQPNPLDAGKNVAYLFEVNAELFAAMTIANMPNTVPPDAIMFRTSQAFKVDGDWANMDAGACAYVDNNQQMIVYSVYHFIGRIKGTKDLALKCLEFRAIDIGGPIDLVEDAWVEIYEENSLQGRRLAILGPWDAAIEDAKHAFVNGTRFSTVRSARYQIPLGAAYVLYPASRFAGKPCVVLLGTGKVVSTNMEDPRWDGKFGSGRLMQRSVAKDLPDAIFA